MVSHWQMPIVDWAAIRRQCNCRPTLRVVAEAAVRDARHHGGPQDGRGLGRGYQDPGSGDRHFDRRDRPAAAPLSSPRSAHQPHTDPGAGRHWNPPPTIRFAASPKAVPRARINRAAAASPGPMIVRSWQKRIPGQGPQAFLLHTPRRRRRRNRRRHSRRLVCRRQIIPHRIRLRHKWPRIWQRNCLRPWGRRNIDHNLTIVPPLSAAAHASINSSSPTGFAAAPEAARTTSRP